MSDWQPGWAFHWRSPEGEDVGPCRSDALYVHSAARECVGLAGGSATVLRAVEGGWRQVAEYTADLSPSGTTAAAGPSLGTR